jgi:transcriptional regulator
VEDSRILGQTRTTLPTQSRAHLCGSFHHFIFSSRPELYRRDAFNARKVLASGSASTRGFTRESNVSLRNGHDAKSRSNGKKSNAASLLRVTLDMLVLKVVALGPGHGYAIAQRLRQISKDFFQVHQGSLYPALHRLEDKGWLHGEWKDSETGREAKYYSLTKKGRKQMETEVAEWERLCDAVGLFLRISEKDS